MTKLVLQTFYKILLHQIAPFGLANWTKKVFPVFPRNIPYRARPNGPPFSFFAVLRQNGCWKPPKGPPFQFFWHCETFFQKKFFHKRVPNSPILWHIEVLLLFLSLRYGTDLGRSRLGLICFCVFFKSFYVHPFMHSKFIKKLILRNKCHSFCDWGII